MKTFLSLFCFNAWVTWVAVSVYADKDSSYYPPGMYNSNVEEKMYWKEGINVLQDLSQFDKLYVQFYSCA